MVAQPLDGRRDERAEVLGGAPDPLVGIGQVGEEPLGATLHHGEQDSVLGAVVVVDGALRDAGFRDDPGDRRRVEALLGHHALGGIEDELARFSPAAIRSHGSVSGHAIRIAKNCS